MADSHDHLDHVVRAMELFRSCGVDRVLHAGDFVSRASVLAMRGLMVTGVFGNNDGDRLALTQAFAHIGGELTGEVCEFDTPSGKGVLYHGTLPVVRDALIQSHAYSLVVLGHGHKPQDEWIGTTRVLNPGTTHGFGHRATVMVYDSLTVTGEILEL